MDGFNDRVGKVFDCLSSSSSSKAWSLSDAQIQRQTWNRDKGNKSSSDIIINNNNNKDDDATLVSSSFDNLFKPNKSNNKKSRTNNTFDDPDDDEDEGGDDDKIDDDLDIRSSIGLDPTLDFEEEEDEYDKIAAGTENAGGPLLYMKDVTHHAPFLNSHNVLQHHTHTNNNNNNNDDQPMFNAPPQPLLDHARKFKSILKRKTHELEKPSPKRVRFDPTCKHHDAPQLDGVPVPQVSENGPGVPDYLLNPSKYTRYTFNEDDDKSSNTEAYYDFLEQIKKSKDVGLEQKPSAADLSASMVFIPRKKRGDAATSTSDGQVKESSTGVGIGIAAVEVQQDEVSDMLQDEPDVDAVCAKPPKLQKPSRQYRSKVEDHDSVS